MEKYRKGLSDLMKYYICLRDDDTSYYTSPDELIKGYEFVWGNYPITLATIPFIHGSSHVMSSLDPLNNSSINLDNVQQAKKNQYANMREWEKSATLQEASDYYRVYPLNDNSNLIEFLKQYISCGKVEIAQHGVFHQYTPSGAEMRGGCISYETVRYGKEYLEKLFGIKINTFIPPSNSIDLICAKYIKQLDMQLFCSGGIKYSNHMDKIKSYLSDKETIKHNIKRKMKKSDIPLFMANGIYVFGSLTYDPFKNYDSILDLVESQLDKTGFAALGTHYTLLKDDSYRKNYLSVVRQLSKRNDIEFVTANQYYKLMMEKYYE